MNLSIAKKAAQAAVPGQEVELIRSALNAVYRSGQTLIRVSPALLGCDRLLGQMRLASWLADNNFLTARPLDDQVREIDGLLVSRWQWLDGYQRAINPFWAGKLLHQFHKLSSAYSGSLPPANRGLSLVLDGYCSLSRDDQELLNEIEADLRAAADQIELRLVSGPLHGDFTTSNLLVTTSGLATIDWEGAAIGPRELDLLSTLAAGRFYRFSGATSFIIGYGLNNQDIGYLEPLIQLRALALTRWAAAVDSDQGRREADRRMAYWRDPDRPLTTWRGL